MDVRLCMCGGDAAATRRRRMRRSGVVDGLRANRDPGEMDDLLSPVSQTKPKTVEKSSCTSAVVRWHFRSLLFSSSSAPICLFVVIFGSFCVSIWSFCLFVGGFPSPSTCVASRFASLCYFFKIFVSSESCRMKLRKSCQLRKDDENLIKSVLFMQPNLLMGSLQSAESMRETLS